MHLTQNILFQGCCIRSDWTCLWWGKNTKKALRLLEDGRNECELETTPPAYSVMKEESLALMSVQGNAAATRGPGHYCSCRYWRLPLQQSCNPHYSNRVNYGYARHSNWRGKKVAGAGESLWFRIYALMNICGAVAADLGGDSYKGREGKSFYGE